MEDEEVKRNFDDDSDEDDQDFQCEESSEEEEEEEEPEAKRRRLEQEEVEKKKVQSEADALWEAMLGGSTPSTPTPKPVPTTKATPTPQKTTTPKPGSAPTTPKAATPTPATPTGTSSLSKVLAAAKGEAQPGVKTFKFAGEIVTVTEEPLTGAKRKRGDANLLGSLKGKKKMSTLDKSSLDWQQFKTKTGIEDELEQETKDGYLERQAFLQRTDLRQFELEKSVRTKARSVKDRTKG